MNKKLLVGGILLAAGGGFAYWYWKKRQEEEDGDYYGPEGDYDNYDNYDDADNEPLVVNPYAGQLDLSSINYNLDPRQLGISALNTGLKTTF